MTSNHNGISNIGLTIIALVLLGAALGLYVALPRGDKDMDKKESEHMMNDGSVMKNDEMMKMEKGGDVMMDNETQIGQ